MTTASSFRQRARRYLPVLFAVTAGTLVAAAAYAQVNTGLGEVSNTGLGTTDIRVMVGRVINAFLGLSATVLVCLIIYAGFLWMTAGGAPEKIEKAKKIIMDAVIGLAIVLMSFAIATFVIRALGISMGGSGSGTGDSNCPSGNCTTGGCSLGNCGGKTSFRVSGYIPSGAGPSGAGWARNLPIKIVFNGEVDAASIDVTSRPTAVRVWECNQRTGDFEGKTACEARQPQPIKLTAVGNTATITLVDANGNAVPFKSDYWYEVRVMSGLLGGAKSAAGDSLECSAETQPLDSTLDLRGYCGRAMAFNDKMDTEAPRISLDAPSWVPAMCQGSSSSVMIKAVAQDDWVVNSVSYLMDGLTDSLVDTKTGAPLAAGAPAKEDNVFSDAPVFRSGAFSIMPSLLSEGSHKLTAVADDLLGRTSNTTGVDLTVRPGHCCNGIKDGDETGADCGGKCGGCLESKCSAHLDCASGFCDPTTKTCGQRAVIESVTPAVAGPGSIVTIRGQHFGGLQGSVTFLGSVSDTNDDVVAQACNPSAWTDKVIRVQVPDNAKTGPLEVTLVQGFGDRTDDNYGSNLTGVFTVSADRMPGICYLDPSTGKAGDSFVIHGNGFGAPNSSQVIFGSFTNLPIATGGWGDQSIKTTVPATPGGEYEVTVENGDKASNPAYFYIPEAGASANPRVIEVTPENGPPGTYVTIRGSGFGSKAGAVKFTYGASGATNVAYGAQTVCGTNWHDDYIVVKVPEQYGYEGHYAGQILGQEHAVIVETAAPVKTSNDTVRFNVTGGTPKAGICAITPDNGPPGTPVQITGENFGSRGDGVHAVDFAKNSEKNRCVLNIGTDCSPRDSQCSASGGLCVKEPMRQAEAACPQWTEGSIITSVPGLKSDKRTWPATGEAYVVAAGGKSSNGIPFRVQDCNAGASCAGGETCCASGACAKNAAECGGEARNSAYGLLMSTDVIPSMPQVVERQYCAASGSAPTLQSPSPFRDQQNTCTNASVYFEFNRGLSSADALIPGTDFTVEECDQAAGEDKPSETCKTVAWNSPKYSWTNCDGTSCRGLQLNPVLSAAKWYRVRLVSKATDKDGKPLNAKDKVGLHEPSDTGARYLDGNFDRREGGDYTYAFKTRAQAAPCELTGAVVMPSRAAIKQPFAKTPFMMGLLSGCSVLQCTQSNPPPFTLDWRQSPTAPRAYLNLATLPTEADSPCLKPVIGAFETPVGNPATLYGDIVATQPISATSVVTVKFTDPKVVRVAPVAGCLGACANADVYAQFNVAMDSATLNDATVTLQKCRNASCLPPLMPVTCKISAERGDEAYAEAGKFGRAVLSCGQLDASSYYLARVSAGAKSLTGAALTGLNYGNFYQWIFRVKDAPDQICAIDTVALEPKNAVLHYVGERAGFKVIARAKKDECSITGQEVNPWLTNWNWSLAAPNPVLGGFVTDRNASPSVTQLLDTDPSKKPASCTSGCLNGGSSVPKHVCGDGRADNVSFKMNGDETVGPEGCERVIGGTGDNTDWCGERCTLLGRTAATCGNGTLEAGEECEKVNGTWPVACKVPGIAATDSGIADDRGCVWLGAEIARRNLNGTVACTADNMSGCCGNGKQDAGEECDMTPNGEGLMKFQGGCKAPGEDIPASGVAKTIGCVLTDPRGARVGCGDGQLGDGEQCDDGNTNDGDGCNSVCLFEGSKPACGPSGNKPGCIAMCGNGYTEEGEDSNCDVPGSTPGAKGCSPETCKHLGTSTCGVGQTENCCGNGIAENGEDAECEDATRVGREAYCTERCLLKGSSYAYARGSFCTDTVKSTATSGLGEVARCEVSTADGRIDPLQYVEGLPQSTFNPAVESGTVSRVTATTTGVTAERAGSANVNLQCDCKTNRPSVGEQDAYCSAYVPNASIALGCGSDSCCRPRPTVKVSDDLAVPICRNGVITLSFDQPMDQASLVQAIEVGVDSGVAVSSNAGNGSGSPCDGAANRFADAGQPRSWLGRVWHEVIGFVRSLFGMPAEAAGTWFCRVKANVVATYGQDLDNTGNFPTIVTVSPLKAYPPNAVVRVRVNPVAKSKWGVGIASTGWAENIRVQAGICALNSVDILPGSLLINDISVPDYPVRAVGRTAPKTVTVNGKQEIQPGAIIAPIEDYGWTWEWQKKPLTAPIVVSARRDATTGLELDAARVHARNPKLGDAPADFIPKNAKDTISVVARRLPMISGVQPGTIETDLTGTAPAYVMQCSNPWPAVYDCESLPSGGVSGTRVLPWGKVISCLPGDVWTPFQSDKTYGLSTFYCRDDAKGTPSTGTPRQAVLPALREVPASVVPGRDIIGEFLFTFDTASTKNGTWSDDAIGWRITTNVNHSGLMPWYRSKGFTGSPKMGDINGYESMVDGRSTYVAFANAVGQSAYTDIATFTYNDGAATETVSVFEQMLSNLETNSNIYSTNVCRTGAQVGLVPANAPVRCDTQEDCWADDNGTVLLARKAKYWCDKTVGFCAVNCSADDDCRKLPEAAGTYVGYADRWCDLNSGKGVCRQQPGPTVTKTSANPIAYELGTGLSLNCTNDLTCRKNGDAFVASRDSYSCDAAKDKLARDARRWSDLLTMRGYLLEYQAKAGNVPRLNAGTYVPGSTTSTWPSWREYLYPALGTALVDDPVNEHARCADATGTGYDAATCWDKEKLKYLCPTGSHVYQYQSLGGSDFILKADLESSGILTWNGRNCIERSPLSCVQPGDECRLDAIGRCVYAFGNIQLGNQSLSGPVCNGTVQGIGGVCGDGVITGSETCEVGQTQMVACCSTKGADGKTSFTVGSCGAGSAGRNGTASVLCNKDCQWPAPTQCLAGTCGDGKIQPPEICDDGSLNGKYGYCSATCMATSVRCGDGKRQPNEACDCGVANGKYAFNGILATLLDTNNGELCGDLGSNAASCGWDCQTAAPRCGDGVVSGTEVCDGGYEDYAGYCGDAAKTGCNTSADCPSGTACKTGTQVCPQPDQRVHRSCRVNNPASTIDDATACTWGDWSCSEPGFCGDGKVQSGEECDDGDAKMGNSTPCLKTATVKCRRNVCGDGFVNRAGGEECDSGANNGKLTPLPDYGTIQNYCTTSCKLSTMTGGFCGDGVLQSETTPTKGPEKCDGRLGIDTNVCVGMGVNSVCKQGAATAASGSCNAKCAVGCSDPNSRPCNNVIIKDGSGKVVNDNDADGLSDECDPDDDNDFVPDAQDCEAKNAAVHGSYHPVGSQCGVDAVAETCGPSGKGDKLDNDCDGQTDNIVIIEGTVINAKDKTGLAGAKLQAKCADKGDGRDLGPVVVSDADGKFRVETVVPGGCGYISFGPVIDEDNQVCLDPSDIVTKPVKYCDTIRLEGNDVLVGIPRPGTDKNSGTIATSFIEWGSTPSDIDFYVWSFLTGMTVDQAISKVGYQSGYNGTPAYNGPPKHMPEAIFDTDAQQAYGPETISFIDWRDLKSYNFFAVNYYFDANKWNPPQSSQGWGSKKQNIFRMYDSNCSIVGRVDMAARTNPLTNETTAGVSGSDDKVWNIGTFNAATGKFEVINKFEPITSRYKE
jgi:cysteine-rich repeat protein